MVKILEHRILVKVSFMPQSPIQAVLTVLSFIKVANRLWNKVNVCPEMTLPTLLSRWAEGLSCSGNLCQWSGYLQEFSNGLYILLWRYFGWVSICSAFALLGYKLGILACRRYYIQQKLSQGSYSDWTKTKFANKVDATIEPNSHKV